jgi:hypothetical protein
VHGELQCACLQTARPATVNRPTAKGYGHSAGVRHHTPFHASLIPELRRAPTPRSTPSFNSLRTSGPRPQHSHLRRATSSASRQVSQRTSAIRCSIASGCLSVIGLAASGVIQSPMDLRNDGIESSVRRGSTSSRVGNWTRASTEPGSIAYQGLSSPLLTTAADKPTAGFRVVP